MLAKDYYERCLEEDRKIIQAFLAIMYDATNEGFKFFKDNFIPLLNNEGLQKIKDCVSAYFLKLAISYNNNIGDLFKKYELDINIKFYTEAHEKIKEECNRIIENKGNTYHTYFYELIFTNSNAFATSILKTYSEYDRPICIERILINMIKNGLYKFLDQDIETILDDLESLACEKEGRRKLPKETFTEVRIPYGENLTAKPFEYNPLIGREKELRQMCAGLMDDEKSVIIHGKPGTGKTTLIKGLAYQIQKGTAPAIFQNKQIIGISATEMVSGCKYVGMVEERMKEIINSVIKNPNIILFIDEIHTLMGLGKGSEENNDVSNILKPYLGDGRIKIIGATTTEEYQIILQNGAFARRFNGIAIPEPKDLEVLEILKKTIERYQEKKGISIPYEREILKSLLDLIIEFSKRKNPNIELRKELYNPDLALTILRNGYNYAQIDGKDVLDATSLIEGFQSMDYFRDGAKKEFEQKTMSLTRKLNLI